jgi:predicted amidohydrolase YtcJ
LKPLDLIVHNAVIHPLEPSLEKHVGLIGVRNGLIVHLGIPDEFSTLKRPGTRVLDAGGATVLPGFHDAHLHLLGLASRLVSLDCTTTAVKSLKELRDTVLNSVKRTPPGAWIRGWGYDDRALTEGRHPNRNDLDAVTPENPVKLTHRSGHAVVLNSAGLRAVGIRGDTADPPDGIIERDHDGQPTGLLFEMGEYVDSRIPHLSSSELTCGIKFANAWLLSHGITTVQDASVLNDGSRWDLLASFVQDGKIASRVVFMPGIYNLKEFVARGLAYGDGTSRLWLGHTKIVMSATTGEILPDPSSGLPPLLSDAQQWGFPVAIHAVEADTIHAAAEILRSHPSTALGKVPHRIEHASELPPAAFRGICDAGVMVVTNPGFIYHSGDRYRREIAIDHHPWLYRIGSLQNAGVSLAFGSDSPVEMPNPLAELYSAVTRQTQYGNMVGLPIEGIGVEDAIRIAIQGGARSAGASSFMGALRPGMAADMVILNQDPFGTDIAKWNENKVLATVVGGEVVWEH